VRGIADSFGKLARLDGTMFERLAALEREDDLA